MEHSYDSRARSLAKTFTWKILALVLGFLVTYGVSGNLSVSTKVTAIIFILGLFAFYFHERIWNNISWGKIKN